MYFPSIQERAADFLLVAGDGHGGTTAFFHRIAVISAGAPVRVAVVLPPLRLHSFYSSSCTSADRVGFSQALEETRQTTTK